jgi:hypothetical protein
MKLLLGKIAADCQGWPLLLRIIGHASMAMAQSPGTFTPTGNMIPSGGYWALCSRTARS